jgi:alpha-galactosidase
MLVVGWLGWGEHLHPTRLTADEQYTHLSLWALLSAPLLIGCDLERLDDFTMNLLTNDEVIAIDQDALGHQACRVVMTDSVQVWVKDLENGGKAIGIFNLSDHTVAYDLKLDAIGSGTPASLRNAWTQKNLGTFNTPYPAVLPSHGVELLVIH